MGRIYILIKSITCVLALGIALTMTAPGQSPSKILKAANKALGGERQLKAVRARQITGEIVRLSDGARGSFTMTTSAPGLYLMAYDIGGFEFATGYNGRSGWVRDSRSGLRTATGEAALNLQAEALYRNSRWTNAKQQRSRISSAGRAPIAGGEANVLVLTTAKGAQVRMYFDQSSALPVRDDIGDRVLEYSDFRSVDGIITPYSMTLSEDGENYRIRVSSVVYNANVAENLFDIPVVSSEPLPDITALLGEIRANAEKVDALLENYSYTETRTDRERDRQGTLVEKSSEKRLLTFYKGYRINRLIEKNGQPLSPDDQAREDRDVEKQVAAIEKGIAEKERREIEARDTGAGSTGQPNGEGQRITIADALKGSLLLSPRRERFAGRDVIVFDYEPDPAFEPRTRNEKLFALCTGAVWVDAATKQVVRLEAMLTKSAGNFIAKAKRGASFTLENKLINDEIWLPSRADIDLQIKILFAGININNLIIYGDYRRFETTVIDAEVKEPAIP